MFLNLLKFTFVAVSVIVVGIFIYSFHDIIFTTVYNDHEFEKSLPEIVSELQAIRELQPQVGVPNGGYDFGLDFYLFFLDLFKEKSSHLNVLSVDGVYVNCIITNNVLHTVHPELIALLFILYLLN
jgi:hypothetical protein